MFTKNYKNILASVIAKLSTNYTALPVKATNGSTYYLNASLSAYPASIPTMTLGFSATSAGFQIGTGDAPESEDDYKLDNVITASGLSGSVNASRTIENGKVYIIFDITITNNSSNDIQVSEIGFFQYLSANRTQGSTSATASDTYMLDRTVLDSPVSILAGDFATIRYKLGCSVN